MAVIPDRRSARLGRDPLVVTVAPMQTVDLPEVLAIERCVYPRPWTPELFATELAARHEHAPRRYLVARLAPADRAGRAGHGREHDHGPHHGGRIVGYAGVLVLIDEAHVTTVAVDPGEHRRKIGTRLLVAALEAGRDLGAVAATLEVRAANRGAQRMYAQLGFAPVGVRPGYYDDTGEDALIMWLHELGSEAVATRLAAQLARCADAGGSSGAPDLHVPWVHGRIGLPEPDADAAVGGAGRG